MEAPVVQFLEILTEQYTHDKNAFLLNGEYDSTWKPTATT